MSPTPGPTLSTPQGDLRGGLQPPNGTCGAGDIAEDPSPRRFTRIATFRIEPSKEQFALLRLRDAQAAQRMNRYSIQLFGERNGWRPPEASPKDTLTKHGRLERDDLSSSIYVACEKRVRNDWKRIGKRIWSGVQVPTYKKGCLPFDSGMRPERGGSCGVSIIRTTDAGYAARLHVTADYAKGDNWITVPLSRRNDIDDRRSQLAAEFSDGQKHILNGAVSFTRDKVLLRVAYQITREVSPPGKRVATLTEFGDGRLILRSEFGSLDYSSRLHALKQRKIHWDGIRRRFSRKSSRSKGSARRHREKLDIHSFSRGASTEMHAWSAAMIRWAISEQCGSLVVILTGADWPAHDLHSKLKYKADEAGIVLTEASLEQESTERAAKQAVQRRRKSAQKLGDAIREISNNPLSPGDSPCP